MHFRSKTLGVMQGYVIQDPWGAIEKRLDNEESDEEEDEEEEGGDDVE